MRILSFILLCLLPHSVFAIDFLQITCIPESTYLEVQLKSIDEHDVFFGTHEPKEQIKRLGIWKKQGYFEASNVRQECHLPESIYVIKSSEPQGGNGTCGAVTRVTLTLTRNGETWLDAVLFGASPEPNCNNGPGVTSISIRDGKQGWGSPNVRICMSKRGWSIPEWLNEYSDYSSEFCEYVFGDMQNIGNVMPLKQVEIEQYFAHKPLSDKCPSISKFKQGLCK